MPVNTVVAAPPTAVPYKGITSMGGAPAPSMMDPRVGQLAQAMQQKGMGIGNYINQQRGAQNDSGLLGGLQSPGNMPRQSFLTPNQPFTQAPAPTAPTGGWAAPTLPAGPAGAAPSMPPAGGFGAPSPASPGALNQSLTQMFARPPAQAPVAPAPAAPAGPVGGAAPAARAF
jgi:hypothetical protein